ncbi:MAG: hypothetical protein WC342_05705 [Methanoregula sp.]|jgi:hypothetical protein
MSKSVSKRPVSVWTFFLLCTLAGTALLVLPVSAVDTPVVTIVAQGSGAYYLGEETTFSGVNTASGSTYLFITGPNLPSNGGSLTSPDTAVVSGNAYTFTVAATTANNTWQYAWFTNGLRLDAGTYTVYAAAGPESVNDLADTAYGTTGLIVKKPYLTSEISSSSVSQGQSFTATGTAAGAPPEVQAWIFGDNYVFTTKIPVNQDDTTFAFTVNATVSGNLPTGQDYLVVQHPMADDQFNVVISGDYVRDIQSGSGTNLFKITGPGSLQGLDAAEALATAIGDHEVHDATLTNDTYSITPFQVTGTGNPALVPASSAGTDSGVTISADGNHAWYLGEKAVFRGENAASGSTYLFITGPNLPANGGKLTSPGTAVVSGNADTFTVVKTNPDKIWEYSYYTANLPVSAGTYTVYAASGPLAADKLGANAATVGIILKKPFITATLSSPDVVQGTPFTVTGVAEGIPSNVRIWILGNNYVFTATIPVNPDDASFTFPVNATGSGNLPAGENYLIVQHPMADGQFNVVISGDYVRDIQSGSGTNLFKITGPGSLQGSDAAEALTAALSERETRDMTVNNDTYTLIPFMVTSSGSSATQDGSVGIPSESGLSGHMPLQYAAPLGACALALIGIVLWKRH